MAELKRNSGIQHTHPINPTVLKSVYLLASKCSRGGGGLLYNSTTNTCDWATSKYAGMETPVAGHAVKADLSHAGDSTRT